MVSFNPNLKKYELKIQVLSDMTMKNYAKFEEVMTCHFRTNMRNLKNFDPST